jgi:chromosome segregation ATPase
MIKRTGVFVCLLIVSAAMVSAANIPYVDVEKAQADIEELQAENEEMSQEIQEMTSENESLQTDIESWQKAVNELDFILDKVRKKSSELATIYSTIVDAATKDRAKETISRNKTLKADLDSKKRELTKAIEDAEKTIEKNSKTVSVNTSKIQRNKDEINMLTASIEKSKNQIEVLGIYIDEVDTVLNEAESVLGTTASAGTSASE